MASKPIILTAEDIRRAHGRRPPASSARQSNMNSYYNIPPRPPSTFVRGQPQAPVSDLSHIVPPNMTRVGPPPQVAKKAPRPPKKVRERPLDLPLFSWHTPRLKEAESGRAFRYITTMEEADEVLGQMMDSEIVGFDVEWKPNWVKGEKENRVSLVQLADESTIALIHVSQMGWHVPPRLVELLGRIEILKTGVGIVGDASKVLFDLGIKINGTLELTELARFADAERWVHHKGLISLARLTETYARAWLDKPKKLQRGNWELLLGGPMQEYAANDAAAGYAIYVALKEVQRLRAMGIEPDLPPIPPPPPPPPSKSQGSTSTLTSETISASVSGSTAVDSVDTIAVSMSGSTLRSEPNSRSGTPPPAKSNSAPQWPRLSPASSSYARPSSSLNTSGPGQSRGISTSASQTADPPQSDVNLPHPTASRNHGSKLIDRISTAPPSSAAPHPASAPQTQGQSAEPLHTSRKRARAHAQTKSSDGGVLPANSSGNPLPPRPPPAAAASSPAAGSPVDRPAGSSSRKRRKHRNTHNSAPTKSVT